jgi:hypothetical protein
MVHKMGADQQPIYLLPSRRGNILVARRQSILLSILCQGHSLIIIGLLLFAFSSTSLFSSTSILSSVSALELNDARRFANDMLHKGYRFGKHLLPGFDEVSNNNGINNNGYNNHHHQHQVYDNYYLNQHHHPNNNNNNNNQYPSSQYQQQHHAHTWDDVQRQQQHRHHLQHQHHLQQNQYYQQQQALMMLPSPVSSSSSSSSSFPSLPATPPPPSSLSSWSNNNNNNSNNNNINSNDDSPIEYRSPAFREAISVANKNIEQILQQNQIWKRNKLLVDPAYFQKLGSGHSPNYLWIGMMFLFCFVFFV